MSDIDEDSESGVDLTSGDDQKPPRIKLQAIGLRVLWISVSVFIGLIGGGLFKTSGSWFAARPVPPEVRGRCFANSLSQIMLSSGGQEAMLTHNGESWRVESIKLNQRSQLEGKLVCCSNGQQVGVANLEFVDNDKVEVRVMFQDSRPNTMVVQRLTIMK